MSSLNAADIIMQLTRIFQAQKTYVLSDQAFEDMLPWERLIEDWDKCNTELTNYMLLSKLTDSERANIKLLVDEHHIICNYVQEGLSKLGQQINEIQFNKKARNNYEHTDKGSIFYDQKK